jgi:hypothetical protein
MAKQSGRGDATIETVRRLARTPGPVGPLVVALGVTGWLVARALLQWFVPLPGGSSAWAPEQLGSLALSLVPTILFGLALFLALWLVAPISDELDLRHVVTRSLLALGVATTVFFVVVTVVSGFGRRSDCSEGCVTGPLQWLGRSLPELVLWGLRDGLMHAVLALPAVLLGGILLWLRRRARPLDAPVAGIIDV